MRKKEHHPNMTIGFMPQHDANSKS